MIFGQVVQEPKGSMVLPVPRWRLTESEVAKRSFFLICPAIERMRRRISVGRSGAGKGGYKVIISKIFFFHSHILESENLQQLA